jgi:hypothetical protein
MYRKKLTKADMIDNIPVTYKQAKVVAGNTILYTTEDGTKVICFWETDIIEETSDGILTLNSGGFRTFTTKARLNQFAPSAVGVYAKKKKWWVSLPSGDVPFEDGMQIDLNTMQVKG